MTIGWSLLAWAMIVWLVPLMYSLLKNECKPKKNIIVGVTLPYEAHQDPEIQAILERFQKELKLTCWAFLAVVVPCLFIRSFSLFITVWLIWITAVCFVFCIPYVRCNKALHWLKEKRGWRRAEHPQAVVELKAAAEELRWISPWWFLPPFLISLIPLLFDRTLWWLWALDAAMIPVFYVCYRHLYRNRAELVDEDSERTLTLTRIRRYNWGKFWVIFAWATGAFNAGMWLALEHIWWCMAVLLAYGLVVCVSAISIELRLRRLQEKLGNSQGNYVDEDERWIWGMLYYNPNDRRILVNARVGINTTFNMARRPAQVITGLCLALILACPLIGVWLMGMERASVELAIVETEITASHFGGHWTVALEDIESVERLEELPRLFRVAGTGMNSALTGTFRSDEWGRLTCCLDPRSGPWLLVRKADDSIYLFGSSSQEEAERVLALLGK